MAKTTEFREEMSLRMTWKKTEKRLRAARHLIEDLDTRVGIERTPFWLPDPEVRLPVAPVRVHISTLRPVGDTSS